MKKTILGAALGIVVSIAPAYGQGYIFFNNYGATTDAIITNCATGAPAESSFTAGLAYAFGTITDQSLLTLSGITQSFNPALPGYFTGPIVSIPGYFTGPITFQAIAYNGTSFAGSMWIGSSDLFTLPSIATGIQPVGEFGPALKPFLVGHLGCIPEPGTLGLIGLGLVSLLIFRRQRL